MQNNEIIDAFTSITTVYTMQVQIINTETEIILTIFLSPIAPILLGFSDKTPISCWQ